MHPRSPLIIYQILPHSPLILVIIAFSVNLVNWRPFGGSFRRVWVEILLLKLKNELKIIMNIAEIRVMLMFADRLNYLAVMCLNRRVIESSFSSLVFEEVMGYVGDEFFIITQ